jgi:hypothetical protein
MQTHFYICALATRSLHFCVIISLSLALIVLVNLRFASLPINSIVFVPFGSDLARFWRKSASAASQAPMHSLHFISLCVCRAPHTIMQPRVIAPRTASILSHSSTLYVKHSPTLLLCFAPLVCPFEPSLVCHVYEIIITLIYNGWRGLCLSTKI